MGDKFVTLVRVGQQTCCLGPSWATNLSPWSELGDKLVALVWVWRQTCRQACAKLGLKDWAINWCTWVGFKVSLTCGETDVGGVSRRKTGKLSIGLSISPAQLSMLSSSNRRIRVEKVDEISVFSSFRSVDSVRKSIFWCLPIFRWKMKFQNNAAFCCQRQ
jgi:hypothetical protein